ncbi:5-formyltetrahydrofolate cyclo-ligase [Ruegeria sediminis]|uniref:5-formyltetrahydrofolate cyclo-ligase n=1 Tax=Ruegeria sediminis TaxID=2583820 RepID=A0ABY2WUU7_9RHOB|nr:5-formyltetrahydrofolate cyclo-ligase [Ruegeria sediminis]TMV06384.1 5-formyltetrahydrofolate cyclo-ligase [Ruegeria sediminis]
MTQDRPGDAPCFAHDLVNGFPVDHTTWRDVTRFRKAERARLLALRDQMRPPERTRQADVISEGLDRLVTPGPGNVVAVYWPIRAELDLRNWMRRCHDAGATVVLPVVAEKEAPLQFRKWSPGCRMTRGIWRIPIPAQGAVLNPDVIVSPVLGIDVQGYRLGNGGGYYDRTLAAMERKPLTIGIGQDFARIDTIYPMPWDIPMDKVLLGDGSSWRRETD